MKTLLSISISIAALFGVYAGSASAQTPVQIRRIEAEKHPMPSFRHVEQSALNTAERPQEEVRPPTPTERKAIRAMKAPNPDAAFSDFLKLEGTGMIRLLPWYTCESEYVVGPDDVCGRVLPNTATHIVRSSGISADIVLTNGDLVAEGFFAISIMAKLGNIPIKDVSRSTAGMQFLTDFVPDSDIDAVKKQYAEIVNGVRVHDHVYTNRFAARPETTYAIRIIAYKNGNRPSKRREWYAENIPFAKRQIPGFLRWQIDGDERVDLTIAFRIITKDNDGSITLVWRILARKEAPTIVFPDGVKMVDFK